MTSDAGWLIYSDESSYNYGAVRGVGAVSLRVVDAARLGDELTVLIHESGMRELKWEKVRTARAAFAAQKALMWALDHALDGELWIETLTWEVSSAAASSARRPTLTQFCNAYTTLLSSVITRHAQRGDRGEQSQGWRIVPDEQSAIPWTRIQETLPQTATIMPARSEPQPLIQLADVFAGLAVFSRAAYDAYERWLCVRGRGQDAHITTASEGVYGSQAYRFVLLDEFYTACVRRLPGISLQTRRGLYTWRAGAPIQFRFHT
ncbi:MAG TPA: hypothetical protein VHR15_21265 [Ktedonobacterales bacterium]|jgi:hypothetical protein|nr:hypothetical protein [Ktedonobacterales bacterium]